MEVRCISLWVARRRCRCGGAIADYTGADRKLVRDARWIAAARCGDFARTVDRRPRRPERFLNMMRVFKPQSPMSVGV